MAETTENPRTISTLKSSNGGSAEGDIALIETGTVSSKVREIAH